MGWGAPAPRAWAGAATVVLLARDASRGEALRAEIAAQSGAAVELLVGGLARPSSVREAAARFRSGHDRLAVLVHCAAVFTASRTVTPDGLETMFATNHLGLFLLTNLLLGPLRAAAPSRVVTVTAPGVFRSGLMREAALPIRVLTRLFGASPAKAAEGVVRVAASPGGGGGRFFKNGREIEAPAYTRDPDVGRRLWDVSAALVGLG